MSPDDEPTEAGPASPGAPEGSSTGSSTEPTPTGSSDAVALAVAELYRLPPEGFLDRRTSLARAARAQGDRASAAAITALRRPTLAAWALNRAVQEDPGLADEVIALGDRLRSAHLRLVAEELKSLRPQRDSLVSRVVESAERAAAASGQVFSPAVRGQVYDTVVAALADADATRAVCSGALTRGLSYSGFGEIDLADAVAHTSTGVPLALIRGGRPDPGHARQEASAADPVPAAVPAPVTAPDPDDRALRRAAAQTNLTAARTALDEATRAVETARAASEAARERVAAARAELAAAEQQDEECLIAVGDAVRARTTAKQTVADAELQLTELSAD